MHRKTVFLYSIAVRVIAHAPGFWCPICGTEGYVYASVARPDGSSRVISLYQCAGCSVVFSDPEKFTARKRLRLRRSGSGDIWTLVPAVPAVKESG